MSVKAIKTKTIAPKFERTNLKYDVDYDEDKADIKTNSSLITDQIFKVDASAWIEKKRQNQKSDGKNKRQNRQ